MLSHFRLVVLVVAVAASGCGDGKEFRQGRQAEARGDASRAYDEYCRAGARSRSGSIGNALARTAPKAADDAECAALAAMDRGDYDEAWRLLMRALDIMPSHPSAAELIRRIEVEHGPEIAAVKNDYLKRGNAALVMGAQNRTTLASASAPRNPIEKPKDKYPAISKKHAPVPVSRAATSESSRNFGTKTSSAPEHTDGETSESAPPTDLLASTEKHEDLTATQLEPVIRSSPASPVRSERGVITAPRVEPTRPSTSRSDNGGFLIVHTLSERDRRYPRLTKTLEGITLKLRDTDSDGETDIDVMDGDRRIKKIRDLMPGGSQTFRGRSGEVYRMTLLGVHHKSHTVRVGIKPA